MFDETNIGSKRATPTRESMAPKKRRLVAGKEQASLPAKMVEQMSHFKRKSRLPKRREPAEAVAPVPTSTLLGPSSTEPQSPDDIVEKLRAQFPSIPSTVHRSKSAMWITFFGSITTVTPNGIPLSNPNVHIEISDVSVCRLEVHHLVKDSFPLLGNESRVASLVATLLPTSEYVLCPGLRSTLTNEINFESKSLRKWAPLFLRADHKDCELWYAGGKPGAPSESLMYKKCIGLSKHLRDMLKRKKTISPATKLKRQSAGSSYSKKFLTPKWKDLRARNEYLQKKVVKRVLKKYKKLDIDVSTLRHENLVATVAEIERTSKKELEHILREADACGCGYILRKKWKQNVTERFDHLKYQSKLRTGHTGNRWSMITIRMALAAYSALKGFNLFQLPSESVLQKYKGNYKESAGEGELRLKEEKELYEQRQAEASSCGRRIPFAVLIFDEVKVQMKLQWNSRDNALEGYAMTKQEMASLSDIFLYNSADECTPKTDYIMQTLWRDHSSNCDIIGPYYTSNGTMTSSFTYACIADAMRKFHAYGFKVTALVCDGASSNLSLLKMLVGRKGAFGYDILQPDPHHVPTSFQNPLSSENVHIIICPTHQLKSMISVLHHSRLTGCKPNRFRQGKDALAFGWESVEGMLQREVDRMQSGQAVRVPGLKESFVYCDSWTRLNVKPAKIMQQQYVLAEIEEFATQPNISLSKQRAMETVMYLTACNQLFERGKTGFIKSTNSPVLASIRKGYQFFTEWADKLISEGYDFTNTSAATTKRMFLAWQTWDLLRLMYYGFTSEFLQKHPGYTIYPIRLNGSAIETVFSQLKYATGGNLMSTNYASARSSILLRGSVSGKSKDDYRNAPLFVRKHSLKKK